VASATSRALHGTMAEPLKADALKKSVGEFAGGDWRSWSSKVIRIMGKGNWDVVSGAQKRPTDADRDEQERWDKVDTAAIAALSAALADDVYGAVDVEEVKTAADMWKMLETMYGTRNFGDRVARMEAIQKMKMDGTVKDFNAAFAKAVAGIRETKEPLSDADICMYYLNAIHHRAPFIYDRYFLHPTIPKLTELFNVMLSVEANGRLLEDNTAVYAMGRNRGPMQCFRCGGYGHRAAECASREDFSGMINGFRNLNIGGNSSQNWSARGGNVHGGNGRGGQGSGGAERGQWGGRSGGSRWRGGRGGGGSRGRGAFVNAAEFRGNIQDIAEYVCPCWESRGSDLDGGLDGGSPSGNGTLSSHPLPPQLALKLPKTQSSGPVLPSPTSPNRGPGAPKDGSLCPPEGLFGEDPARQGQLQVMCDNATTLLSSTNPPLYSQDKLLLLSADTLHTVYIDSGATDSITPLRSAVTKFIPGTIRVNLAAQGAQSMAQGRGMLSLRFIGRTGNVYRSIPNVIVDPSARATYVATSSLQQLGITTTFPGDSDLCLLHDRRGVEICRGHRRDGKLYEMAIMINYLVPVSAALYSAKILSVDSYAALHHALSHLRLGHINQRDLALLVKAGKLPDVSVADLKQKLFCYGCKVGKATQLPYTRPKRERATTPGERVHLDTWGPARTAGLRGEKYMLVLIDEATEFISARLMRSKTEAAPLIKEYKLSMEKQYPNFMLKILRSDNAGDLLLSNDMLKWMKDNGITHEESPPYTPQLNGKAERVNRTIMEPTRSILAMGKLRLGLWSELVMAVVHIKNRIPSAAINGQIPFESLTGKQADVSHLRVLGCDAYALFKASGRSKLEQKADHHILVGYGIDAGTYRLYDPLKKTILVTRDVVFNEEGFVRKRYLPYQDHFGMGEIGGDLFPPPRESILEEVSSPDSGNPLNVPSSDDDDDDDEQPVQLPISPPAPAPPAAPVPRRNPPRQVNLVPVRPATPPSPTPVHNIPVVLEGGPASPVVETRHDDMQSWRGNLLEDEEPPMGLDDHISDSTSESSLDPLTDPRYNAYQAMVTVETTDKIDIPSNLQEAMRSPYADKWREACLDEMSALENNKTWELIENPGNHPVLTGKWVFDVKDLGHNRFKFKARWVARGFNQQHGIDYDQTYAPVMHGKAWHILLAVAAQTGYKTRQFDVSNAFLNGDLSEKVYVEQPHGFEKGTNRICSLLKSLYGLKQAPNVWFQLLVEILRNMGFQQTQSDNVVFVKDADNMKVIVGGHVDDLLVLAPTEVLLDDFGKDLAKHLKIKSSDLDTFLGVEIIQNHQTGTISIHQRRKVTNLLTEQGMLNARPVSTPLQPNVYLSRADCPTTQQEREEVDSRGYRGVVGSLMHIMTMSRPDICPAVKMLSEVLDNPSKKHVQGLNWLLRYLSGTPDYGITYIGHKDPRRRHSQTNTVLHGYYDADWARDEHDRKSRSGYVFLLAGGAISWWSGKQDLVATSTTHAEYIGQDQAARELVWILQFLKEIGFSPEHLTKIYGHSLPTLLGDNQGALALAKNGGHHKLSKHFDVRLHAIRGYIQKKILELVYCPSNQNTADIMTKPLSKQVFEFHREGMGIQKLEGKH
jgi:transposase InsO family protein